ncbi:hypothetical protein WN51_00255 [Melipona quadrifasciata]|uniref:Uncharacterized protein n=1 Tax=Melipona quadrifasciata TaxID=166423 RepID=A0A0N0U5J3_9HYME|nr:hypothetical protein WN51_00255 [Melipona quadrifasciata]
MKIHENCTRSYSLILKPPKSRHPLQNLNFSSSSENSPATTTKIKRRVSFAEKKHVKEFCNSLEQGTVWNNTYEENDLSNLKIPCSSNQKECEIESIFKKNIFDNHENDAQSDYNKVIEENINITENIVQENKSISLTNLQLENTNHISKSITPYEDCNKKLNKKMSMLSDHNDLNIKSIKDTCVDLTKVVCNNICSDVNYIKDTITEAVPENISMELTQIILPSVNTQNMSMELTVPLLSVINDNINDVKMTICENDRTKNFHNKSMCTLQSNSNYCVSCSDNDNKTTFFNDVPMDITKTVCKCECNIAKQDEKTKFIKLSQCEYNIAKQDEKTKLLNTSMEITSVVPANTRTKIHREDTTNLNRTDNNIKKLKIDPFYETLANLSRTRLYSSESVEFDFTDVTTSPKIRASEHQNKLQTTIQNTPYTQSNSTSIFDSCNSHISSNKTITFHNNSTFTNILSLDVRNNSGKARVTDCETNINEHKAIVRTQSQTEINSDTDSIKIRQSVLSDNIQNRDLADFTTYKENNFSKGVENDVLDKCSLIKVQSSVNVTSSMVLHESVQQDIFVSDLRKNNIVNSKINKDKDKHAQTIISHPRRTYTIQSLDSNHTFIISNKGNTNVSQINDNNFDINNQGNNVLNSEKCLQKNESYNEECPINKSDIIFNENTEILESIKTPTFYCLDDLSDTDQSINVNCNQEINCFSKNKNDKHENASNLNYYQANVLDENVRKSCTFLIKCASSNSKFDQVQADEIQKLELLENIQDLCLNNSNFENQNIQCLSNVRAICENTLKVNDNGKSVDINRMEINKESYTNEKLEQSLKTHICIEGNVVIELNLFSSLMNELKDYTKSDEIIWEIYHENIEKNMFIAGFISCSLLVVIFIRDLCDVTNNEFIKEIKLISRLADDADILINIVHRIILEKLDVKKLLDLYKNREDILLMLDFISKEVKLAMDFMFELKCLNDLNLMEITRDRITFISQTRTGNIILEITVDIKPFDKIESRNISIHCLMGSVREEDVKKLIMNIKRDHKFLRKYINDVKDYIHLVEESVT